MLVTALSYGGREGTEREGLILLFKTSAKIQQHCDQEEEEEADKKRTFSGASSSIFSKPRVRERGDRAFYLREILARSLNSLLPLHCCRFLDPNCRRFPLSRSIHYYTILFVPSFLLSFLLWTVASFFVGVVGVFLFFVLACQRLSLTSKGFRPRSTMHLRKLSSLFDSKHLSRVFFIILDFLSRLLFRFSFCDFPLLLLLLCLLPGSSIDIAPCTPSIAFALSIIAANLLLAER